MTEKLSPNSPEIRLLEKPIRSINKKMVFIAVILAVLAILLIIYLIPSSPVEKSAFGNINPLSSTSLEDSQKFQELKQLPDSYDGIQTVDGRTAPEPIHRQAIEEPLESVYLENRQESQGPSEHGEAKRSPVLFRSERPEAETNSSVAFQGAQAPTQKSTLMFNQKEQFLKGDAASMPGAFKKNASRFVVQQGTLIPAVLLSAINTDLPGPILAQVTQNVFNTTTGKHLLIPQGSKLVGEYNSSVSNGQQRAQVIWTRLLLPNGNSMDLGRMPSVDRTGASGHPGSIHHHYDKLVLGVLVTSLLSSSVGLSSAPANPGAASPQQVIGQSVGQEVARVGTKMAEKTLDIPPTISVTPGTKINIFTMSDLQLVLYH